MSSIHATVEDKLLPFALELAEAAGHATLKHFRRGGVVDDKADGKAFIDPVTAGDRESEATMRRLIESRFPDHGIVGEEQPPVREEAAFVWVLDPIDGTRAFVLGLPVWGTLIGLLHDGEPVLGVMAQPVVDDVFYGSPAGSFLRHRGMTQRLSTRSRDTFDGAAIATTSPGLFSAGDRTRYDRIENACGLVRYGTDCYGYALLAAGFVDLVIESGLKPFDIVALIPIIAGAGGKVTDWSGNSAAGGGRILAAGDPRLHDKALQILSD